MRETPHLLRTQGLVPRLVLAFFNSSSIALIYGSPTTPGYWKFALPLFFFAYLVQQTLEFFLVISIGLSIIGSIAAMPGMRMVLIGSSPVQFQILTLSTCLLIFQILRRLDIPTFLRPVSRDQFNQSHLAGVIALLATYFWSNHSNISAFALLSKAEDNAAWLLGLSSNIVSPEKLAFSLKSGSESGPFVAIFHFISQANFSLTHGGNFSYIDNSKVLLGEYRLITVLIIGFAAAFTLRLSSHFRPSWKSLFSSLLVFAIVMMMAIGSIFVRGHLSFLVAYWLVTTAILYSLYTGHSSLVSSHTSRSCHKFFCLILVMAASQSWKPLTPLVVFVLAYFLIDTVFGFKPNNVLKAKAQIKVMFLSLAIFTLIFVTWKTLGPVLITSIHPGYFGQLLSETGGVETPSYLFSSVLYVGLVLCVALISKSLPLLATLRNLLGLLIFYYLIILTASLTMGNHRENYASSKIGLLVFLTSISVFACVSPTWSIKPTFQKSLVPQLLCVLLLVGEGSFIGQSRNMVQPREAAPNWIETAFKSIADSPELGIVCLPPSSGLYSSYLCNRMVQGLQGNTDDPNFDNWTGLGVYTKDPTFLINLPQSFFKDIVFLVPIEASLLPDTDDAVVNRVFERIPWSIVQKYTISSDTSD